MELEKTEQSKDHLSSVTTKEEGEQAIEQKITQTDHDAPVEVEYKYADGKIKRHYWDKKSKIKPSTKDKKRG